MLGDGVNEPIFIALIMVAETLTLALRPWTVLQIAARISDRYCSLFHSSLPNSTSPFSSFKLQRSLPTATMVMDPVLPVVHSGLSVQPTERSKCEYLPHTLAAVLHILAVQFSFQSPLYLLLKTYDEDASGKEVVVSQGK
jgi:hypothetical protein